MDPVTGRRRPDARFGDYPEDIQPGDIWKVLMQNGSVLKADEYANGVYDVRGNLTNRVWKYASPSDGRVGILVLHTVREHDDGTVSIRPDDGSSNSVFYDRGGPNAWHGYVEHNVWKHV